MAKDKIEKIKNSLIQHGKLSNRIYLMKLDKSDVPQILDDLEKLAKDKGYTKIFAKVPAGMASKFIKNKYVREAGIPGFFKGVKGCIFVAKYFGKPRKKDKNKQEITKIINLSIRKRKEKRNISLPKKFTIEKATADDVVEMSKVYSQVFQTYPFPIDDPKYLLKTMKTHVKYYLVKENDKIVAVSSAEIDYDALNAEMTDFATLNQYRGKNISSHLLKFMEKDIKKEKLKIVYTIARAKSYGMNITFARNGYHFAGTLINNTNISGDIESMNVWYKSL